MSNFFCEHCGAVCVDGGPGKGYITGCEHYPADDDQAAVPAGMDHVPQKQPDELISQAREIANWHPSHDAREFAARVLEFFGVDLKQPTTKGSQ